MQVFVVTTRFPVLVCYATPKYFFILRKVVEPGPRYVALENGAQICVCAMET